MQHKYYLKIESPKLGTLKEVNLPAKSICPKCPLAPSCYHYAIARTIGYDIVKCQILEVIRNENRA